MEVTIQKRMLVAQGFVARNSQVHILAARGKKFSQIKDPAMAEALALRETCRFAAENQFQKVILEGDAKTIIDFIKNAEA